MGKGSGGSKQSSKPKTDLNAQGPGLSDPGPQMQLMFGGMPQGPIDFSANSFAQQLAQLAPGMMNQITQANQAPQAPAIGLDVAKLQQAVGPSYTDGQGNPISYEDWLKLRPGVEDSA